LDLKKFDLLTSHLFVVNFNFQSLVLCHVVARFFLYFCISCFSNRMSCCSDSFTTGFFVFEYDTVSTAFRFTAAEFERRGWCFFCYYCSFCYYYIRNLTLFELLSKAFHALSNCPSRTNKRWGLWSRPLESRFLKARFESRILESRLRKTGKYCVKRFLTMLIFLSLPSCKIIFFSFNFCKLL
jgi:hypothetical protein